VATCIGIDIGGTKIAAGLVDISTGAVLSKRVIPTLAHRPPEIIEADVRQLIASLRDDATATPIAAIGLGMPELVDLSGQLRSNAYLPDDGHALRAHLSAIAPVCFDSDARAAAAAEAQFGAGRPFANFAYVTISTGLSYCLMIDGKPYRGARGFAIHFGSTISYWPGNDEAGTDAIVEEFASGKGLAERYDRLSGRSGSSAEDVLARETADAIAARVLSDAVELLGDRLAQMIDMIDPGALVIGGGLGLSEGFLRDRLEPTIRRRLWTDANRDTPILPAALGAEAGLIGAAWLGYQAR
jgi:glucokinase